MQPRAPYTRIGSEGRPAPTRYPKRLQATGHIAYSPRSPSQVSDVLSGMTVAIVLALPVNLFVAFRRRMYA
jgi:hypothetical protein